MVCHIGECLDFGLKQFQLLLPEFDQYQLTLDPTMLTPADKPMMKARNRQLEFVSDVDWSGKRVAVLLVPPGFTLKIFDRYFDLQAVAASSGTVYPVSADRVRR